MQLLTILWQTGLLAWSVQNLLWFTSTNKIPCGKNELIGQRFVDISDEQLDGMVRALIQNYPNAGKPFILHWFNIDAERCLFLQDTKH